MARWTVRRICRKCRISALLLSHGRRRVCRLCSSLSSCFCSATCSPCAILTCVIAVSLAVLLAHVVLIYWNVKHSLRTERAPLRGSSIDAHLLGTANDEEANSAGSERKRSLKELDSQLHQLVVQHSPSLDHNRRIVLARRAYVRAFRWIEQSRQLTKLVRNYSPSQVALLQTASTNNTQSNEDVLAISSRYRYCPLVPPALDYHVTAINHVHDWLRVHSFSNATMALLFINNVPQYTKLVRQIFATSLPVPGNPHIHIREPVERIKYTNDTRAKLTGDSQLFDSALELASQINHFGLPFWSPWLHAQQKVSDSDSGTKQSGINAGGLCAKRHRVAIIIPFRDRAEHLFVLLAHLHLLLSKQLVDFNVFVVEQWGSGQFNKARVMNAGFLEILKRARYDCYVFHDVDLVPEDDRVLYSCTKHPKHLTVAIDEMDYRLAYPELVGGALVFSEENFLTVNGYSNMFWGWGAEDDDEAYRIMHVGLRILRPPTRVARYTMMKHEKRKPADWRRRTKLLHLSTRRYMLDGINNLQYKLESYNHYPLYTHIVVDIDVDFDQVS